MSIDMIQAGAGQHKRCLTKESRCQLTTSTHCKHTLCRQGCAYRLYACCKAVQKPDSQRSVGRTGVAITVERMSCVLRVVSISVTRRAGRMSVAKKVVTRHTQMPTALIIRGYLCTRHA